MTMRKKESPETYRNEMMLQRLILDILKAGPKTVPELANELKWPVNEVMMYVMAMRRYGMIEELPKGRRDRYFKYGLKE